MYVGDHKKLWVVSGACVRACVCVRADRQRENFFPDIVAGIQEKL